MVVKKTNLKKKTKKDEKSLKEAIAELRSSEEATPKKKTTKKVVKKKTPTEPKTEKKAVKTYTPSPPKGPQDKRIPAEAAGIIRPTRVPDRRPERRSGRYDNRHSSSHGYSSSHHSSNTPNERVLPVHRYQRIGVFVDVQNMYYSAKQLYNKKVNFKRLLEDAVKNRQLIRALAYGIKADIKEEANFFEALLKIGFEVKTKDLQVFVDGSKKGDWDVGLAMDVMRLSPRMDVIVIVSGDGDFKELVEYVKSLGCRVEVMSFKKTTSTLLLGVADSFTDLASHKYLIS